VAELNSTLLTVQDFEDELEQTKRSIVAEEKTYQKLEGLMETSWTKLASFRASEEECAQKLAAVDTAAIKVELAEYAELLMGASQDGATCNLCMDSKADTVFARYGHTSCAGCANKLFPNKRAKNKCPFCQEKVEFVMPLYLQ
jgi:hypothetical protein